MNAGIADPQLDSSHISTQQYRVASGEIPQELRAEDYTEEQIADHEATSRAQTR